VIVALAARPRRITRAVLSRAPSAFVRGPLEIAMMAAMWALESRVSRLQLRSVSLLTAATLVGLLAGCGEQYPPFNRLTAPRVLAIASDPPAPMTGETTTITPVLYLPEGVSVTSYEWSWCPEPGEPSDGYPCQMSEEEREELDLPAFDLGSGATATFENSVMPELLWAVCGDDDCFNGFPIQIKVVVRVGDTELAAVRRLRLRFDPAHEANALHSIAGLDAVLGGADQPIDGADLVTIPRDEETVIRARAARDSAEEYTGHDEDGEPTTEVERLIFTWYVESGNTNSQNTTFLDGVVEFEDALENEWTPAEVEDYSADTARVIVVLRDNREGVTFAEGIVGLGDAQ